MGIPVYPGPTYCDRCRTCFAEDRTPNTVVLSLSGIKCGKYWEPGYLAPPNRMIVLENIEGCDFVGGYEVDGQSIIARWWAGIASLVVTVGIAIPVFTRLADPCTTYFTNSMTDEWSIYYEGKALIMCAKSFSIISESQHIADLLGIEKVEDMKFEFWPVSEQELMIRFARHTGGTNITMKINRDEL